MVVFRPKEETLFTFIYFTFIFVSNVGISKRNKENRAKQKINYTSGSKSFAQLHYEEVSTSFLTICYS